MPNSAKRSRDRHAKKNTPTGRKIAGIEEKKPVEKTAEVTKPE